MVGRPFSHVVRGVLCEGDEGTAEVRDQHWFPPSASAVRECSGNYRGRSGSLSEIMQIVTSAVRVKQLCEVRTPESLQGPGLGNLRTVDFCEHKTRRVRCAVCDGIDFISMERCDLVALSVDAL